MSEKEKELAALRRVHRDVRNGRIVHDSRERLKRISRRKFKTCFIYALSEFESQFGVSLWGHGLLEEEMTPEQIDNRIIWEEVRKNILDKGNAQSRALGMEIDLHRVEFQGYHMHFGGKIDE